MPNSVLWVCLVAIWLFVLVPMVIQGRPEIRKSTPVAAATRVLKRGEEAVRRRGIGAGAHPHDPDYQPVKAEAADTDSARRAAPADPLPLADLEDANDLEEADEVDPARIPGKVPTRKRASARTVVARMRRVVSVTATRTVAEEVTEVIPVVDTDRSNARGADAGGSILAVDEDAIIDAEVVEERTGIVEVQAVEVIDVEITERIETVADEAPTAKIGKVSGPKTSGMKRGRADGAAEPVAATLFDLDTVATTPADDDVKDEPAGESDQSVEDAKTVSESDDAVADEAVADEAVADEAESVEAVAEADEVPDEVDGVEEDSELTARWDDVDPNELTQVLMTRPGRGGFDPEVDQERLDLKYKERQRVLLTLVGLTLLTVGAGVLVKTPGWIAAGVAGFFLVSYLVFLRRAVKSEAQIRQRRLARLERSRREEVARRRRSEAASPTVDVAPQPRPRVRRPSGMTVVSIDDEDPVFDHLPIYEPPRMMRSDDGYRAAAVG